MKATFIRNGLGPVAVAACILLATSGLAASNEKFKEELHKTYPLSSKGQVRVHNVNGPIRIIAWDKTELQLDAVKKGKKQTDIDAVKIEIDADADSISIRTKYPSSRWGKSNSASVEYELKVPRRAELKEIHNVNGSIDIDGVRGEVKASTVNAAVTVKDLAADAELESVNGSVKATFASLEGVTRVRAKNVNGGVELNLPANADAHVSANTVNGSIRGGEGLEPHKRWPVGQDMSGTLGKGTTQVSATTVNGSISIANAE